MRRNQLRFLSLPAESLAVRLSSFAKFSGATRRRMKPPGNERKTYGKITLTYFLANPNLEGEIILKGGQVCNIPNFQFGMLYIRSSLHIIFYCILVDPRKFYATQGTLEKVGDFVIFIFEFSQILKIESFDFIYFIFNYFYYKNLREGIK